MDAIFEATIQVLLRDGADRLTTTRVAERAGVSVGTLYQYYPKNPSLLHAVLELHLGKVTAAVENICRQSHHKPIPAMVQHLVEAFVHAKMERKDASVALYAIASENGGAALVQDLTKRSQDAITAMLRTAPTIRLSQVDFTATMLVSTMAGTTRAILEAGATRTMVKNLRRHLILLCEAYLTAAAS